MSEVQDPQAAQAVETPAADGERFMPGLMNGTIELEHLHRYNFVLSVVAGKSVLDIASGEGYGTALISKHARRVVGVDIDRVAVEHARRKYPAENTEFRLGACSRIPAAEGEFDVVVSFETIEHHSQHDEMMSEIQRVLRPGGLLIISSPDKLEYSDKVGFHNPFHVKELYRDEFQALLQKYFRQTRHYGQRVLYASNIHPLDGAGAPTFQAVGDTGSPSLSMPAPQYFIALASNGDVPELPGGVFEQTLAVFWQDVTQQLSTKIAELIHVVAGPDSPLLQSTLRSQWYLDRNPDVAAQGVDPFQHWLDWGIRDGRLPALDPVAFVRLLQDEREGRLHQAVADGQRDIDAARRDFDRMKAALEGEMRQVCSEAAQHSAALQNELEAERTSRTQEQLLQGHKAAAELAEQARAFEERSAAFKQADRALRDALEDAYRKQLLELTERQAASEQSFQEALRALQEQAHADLEQARALETELRARFADLSESSQLRISALQQALTEREAAHAAELSGALAACAAQHREQSASFARALELMSSEHAAERNARTQQLEQAHAEIVDVRQRYDSVQRAHASDREAALAGFQAQLAAQRQEGAEREAALVRQAEQIRDAAQAERKALELQHAETLSGLQRAQEDLQSSWSWRMTAPLRWTRRQVSFGSSRQADAPGHEGDTPGDRR